ncbi:hypothetical protein MMC22_006821 [Lobaria immixta]|nr:hypothetical protein [Lobaria immixta]
MSQCTPTGGPQEKSLLLVIQFTRTSPSFDRQKRVEALQQLVHRCSRDIRTNIDINEAALNSINKHPTSRLFGCDPRGSDRRSPSSVRPDDGQDASIRSRGIGRAWPGFGDAEDLYEGGRAGT